MYFTKINGFNNLNIIFFFQAKHYGINNISLKNIKKRNVSQKRHLCAINFKKHVCFVYFKRR